jgi:hypothetical protein
VRSETFFASLISASSVEWPGSACSIGAIARLS